MELSDIIDAINKNINATLVLHKKMDTHPKFKVYKIYTYDLYRVDARNKELLLEWKITKNAPSEEIRKAWNEADKEYLAILVDWISSDKYKKIK